LKGQVDIVPAGAKTRVACVRCTTTFDTIFVDGEIKALLPQTGLAAAVVESAGSEVRAGGHVSAAAADFMSAPVLSQESEFDAPLQVEELPVPEDDFSLSSQDLLSEESLETAQVAPEEISHEVTPPSVETWTHETSNAEQDFVAAPASVKPDGASKVSRPPSDVYGMGVRLMQVSPARLLLAGLSFIAFIVFCNWLIKPTAQPADTTRLIATANNYATNQSANRVAPTAPSAQLPVERQADQPSKESGVAFIPAEAKESTPPPAAVAAPSVEPVAAKPAAEEKPAAAPNRADGAKAGKVTIQVGSYNAATEAEARVANLKSAGFEARSVAVEIPKRGTWYRVQSGRFVSRDEAERYGRQLRDKGIVSSFITTDVQE
jgi:cell division septation protein DedD